MSNISITIIFFIAILNLAIAIFYKKEANSFKYFTVKPARINVVSLIASNVISVFALHFFFNYTQIINYDFKITILSITAIFIIFLFYYHIVIDKFAAKDEIYSINQYFRQYATKYESSFANFISLSFCFYLLILALNSLHILCQEFFPVHSKSVFIFVISIIAIYSTLNGFRAINKTHLVQLAFVIFAFFALSNIMSIKFGSYGNSFAEALNQSLSFKDSLLNYFLLAIIPCTAPVVLHRLIINIKTLTVKQIYKNSIIPLILLFLMADYIFLCAINLDGNIGIKILTKIDLYIFTELTAFSIFGLICIIFAIIDANLNICSITLAHDIFKIDTKSEHNFTIIRVVNVSILFIACLCSLNMNLISYEFFLYLAYIYYSLYVLPLFSLKLIKQLDYKFHLGSFIFSTIVSKITLDNNNLQIVNLAALIVTINYIAAYLYYFKFTTLSIVKFCKKQVSLLAKKSIQILADFENFSLRKYLLVSSISSSPQYQNFAIFLFFTTISPILIWGELANNNLFIIPKYITIIICITFLFKNYWSDSILNNINIIWYFTLAFTLPFSNCLLLLGSNFDNIWLVNFALGSLMLTILVDWLSYLLITISGALMAFIVIANIDYQTDSNLLSEETYFWSFYTFLYSLIAGVIFSKPKHQLQQQINYEKQRFKHLNSQLEDRILKKTKNLSVALDIKKDLLNNISHEIRTPMAASSNLIDYLVSNHGKLDREMHIKYLKEAQQALNKLKIYTTNLLDLSKYEAGKMLFDMKLINFDKLIEQSIRDFKYIFEQYGYDYAFTYQQNQDYLTECDSLRLEQLINNILNNIIKHAQASHIQINLELLDNYLPRNGQKCSAIKLEIIDNGQGIPKNDIDKIFNIFQQSSKTTTKAGGTGLGLAICKEIIKGHRGEITAENIYKNKNIAGLKFTIILPQFQPKNLENKHLENLKIQSKNNINNILLVDDDPQIQLSTDLMLQSLNYNVTIAKNGKEAIEKISNEKYDLILLDMMMPDFTGLEVLEQIEKYLKDSNTEIILQTGITDKMQLDAAIKYGVTKYLAKPYDIIQLKNIIKM